jgi:hypothetical protein
MSVFGIAVAIVVVVWKKLIFIKSTFSWGWFEKNRCLVKTAVEIEVEEKIV